MSQQDYDANSWMKPARGPWQITGRMVLFGLFGFFGIVFAVNGVMIHAALSTFSGLDTESSYQAGRKFEREVALAKQQDEQHWRVSAKLTPTADGSERVDIEARDAAGQLLTGLEATAVFERPTDRRLDRTVDVKMDSPGRFHGNAELSSGQWDLVIELSRQDERAFRSINRVVLR
jgi:nitrogen fixation protein FixH